MTEIILHPDSKGRFTIGELAQGMSSYRVLTGENSLILTPTDATEQQNTLLALAHLFYLRVE